MKKIITTIMVALIALTVSCGNGKNDTKDEKTTVESTQDKSNSQEQEGTNEKSKESSVDKNKTESKVIEVKSADTKSSNSIANGNKSVFKDKLDKIEEGVRRDLDSSYNGPNQIAIAAAREEYSRWDKALNEIYNELKNELPKNDMRKLEQEEKNWINEKEEKAKAAGEEMKGRTGEQLLYNGSLAATTKERCYELVEKYMK